MTEIKALIEKRADPQIFKHTDGTYYFTGSYPVYDRIVLRASNTVRGLKDADEITIWTKHNDGEMSQYIWAPEIHYIDGSFIIYFAAKSSDNLSHTSEAHKIYILRCDGEDPMKDPWVEEGAVDTGWKSFSLDATSFTYDNQRYFVWAQMEKAELGNSNIYIAKMKDYKTLELPAVCLTRPEHDWECVTYKVNEGPAVIQKDSLLYLTYSASATDHNYCVGMLTMKIGDNPLDEKSWTKSEKPIFITDESIQLFGPGHNSFTYSEDDSEILFVFHARDYKDIQGDPLHDHNRHARVIPFDEVLKERDELNI